MGCMLPNPYLVVHPTNRKWVITLVINGISGVSPLITRVINHLLSGMNHQVGSMYGIFTNICPNKTTHCDVVKYTSTMGCIWERNFQYWALDMGIVVPQFVNTFSWFISPITRVYR